MQGSRRARALSRARSPHDDARGRVVANGCGLPARVVARRVALVELEAAVGVPARVEKGAAKGAQAAVLRVAVLVVGERGDERLHGHGRAAVRVAVALRDQPPLRQQNVGVGRQPGHGHEHVLVQRKHLLRRPRRRQQLARNLLLGRNHHAVGAQHGHAARAVADCADGVLDLVQAALGRKGRCAGGKVAAGRRGGVCDCSGRGASCGGAGCTQRRGCMPRETRRIRHLA